MLRFALLTAAAAAAFATPAFAEIDRAAAKRALQEAAVLCKDGRALWRVDLCGLMLVADPHSRHVVANRPGAGLHFNPWFPNLNLAMAPPLRDGMVTYADGTRATVDQMAQDVSAFLAWTAEPESDSRKNNGLAVLIFLLFGTILSYMAYQNVWAGKKH